MKVREEKGMINLIIVQGCSEPSLFHSASVESCWTVLIAQNLFPCFAPLSLSTAVCDRSELSLSEPAHSGVGICLLLSNHHQGKRLPREDVPSLIHRTLGEEGQMVISKINKYITIDEKGLSCCQHAQIL